VPGTWTDNLQGAERRSRQRSLTAAPGCGSGGCGASAMTSARTEPRSPASCTGTGAPSSLSGRHGERLDMRRSKAVRANRRIAGGRGTYGRSTGVVPGGEQRRISSGSLPTSTHTFEFSNGQTRCASSTRCAPRTTGRIPRPCNGGPDGRGAWRRTGRTCQRGP
jgi:hypothetical protein